MRLLHIVFFLNRKHKLQWKYPGCCHTQDSHLPSPACLLQQTASMTSNTSNKTHLLMHKLHLPLHCKCCLQARSHQLLKLANFRPVRVNFSRRFGWTLNPEDAPLTNSKASWLADLWVNRALKKLKKLMWLNSVHVSQLTVNRPVTVFY